MRYRLRRIARATYFALYRAGAFRPIRVVHSLSRISRRIHTNQTAPMKTLFYDRTAYSLSSEPVPNCFVKLDDHFDTLFSDHQECGQPQCLAGGERVQPHG